MPRGRAPPPVTFPEGLRVQGVEGVQALPGVWGLLSTEHKQTQGSGGRAPSPKSRDIGREVPWGCREEDCSKDSHCRGASSIPSLPGVQAPPALTFSRDAGSRASLRSRSAHLLGWAALCKNTLRVPLSSSTQGSRHPSSPAPGLDTKNPAGTFSGGRKFK